VGVTVSAASAFGDEHAFVRLSEIVKRLTGFVIVYDRSDGDFDLEVLTVAAMPVAAFAMAAALGAKSVIEAEFQQGVVVDIGRDIDIAAVSSVTAAGAASWDKFFSAEGDAAMSAVSGFDCDFGFVDEHDEPQRHREHREKPTNGPYLCPLCLCGLLYWLDGNESSGSAFILELHDTGNLCEQRIVFADADIQTGLELRPSLANEDRTTRHELARKPLDSEPLGVTIAAVA
jgi:hypothetical protein